MLQPVPVNEADRLATLALYEVLDTPPEFALDALTELAAQICNCPAAILSLIEERRQCPCLLPRRDPVAGRTRQRAPEALTRTRNLNTKSE